VRIVLLVNDSYFSYQAARPIIDQLSEHIALVVLSTKTKGTGKSIRLVFHKCGKRYFIYRSFVELLSHLLSLLCGGSVKALAKRRKLKVISSRAINHDIRELGRFDLGLAFNFDQIIKQETIDRFSAGIVNVHAGRLPKDKGISPAVWAFGRGDSELWSSIYYMDAGIDSGAVIEQFAIAVVPGNSLFATYSDVCQLSGRKLLQVVRAIIAGGPVAGGVQRGEESYNSWPDATIDRLQRRNGRCYFCFRDLLAARRSCSVRSS
jgi:folate-dependent phosphoribosylglycinamide formyltransferase PurN